MLLGFVLALFSGSLVGFTLGLIGGCGSILATPLMLYVVGLEPHVAIGTSAFAVSVNAFANFANHVRKGDVRWKSAILFALFGIAGAAIGSTVGKTIDGKQLLFLFAILMIGVGVLMLRNGHGEDSSSRAVSGRIGFKSVVMIIVTSLAVGALSGFFGIGGGFLIVPGLLFSTGMSMIEAVGSSLLSVGTFGLTTAVNYAIVGKIDWPVAMEFIVGGIAGGLAGTQLAGTLSHKKSALRQVFAGLVFVVALYMLYENAIAFGIRL
ncbi:MAG: sulfite exporter TauE/SafE family protein [Acidiphilium sp.]|nr:sulfite exporter TauE/SafE family protein [Acidiphilium sp.]